MTTVQDIMDHYLWGIINWARGGTISTEVRVARALGISVQLCAYDEGVPDGYTEMGVAPGDVTWVRDSCGNDAIMVGIRCDGRASGRGYVLHEVAHILDPDEIDGDEMGALVAQSEILRLIPNTLAQPLIWDMEGYGYDWSDDPRPPAIALTCGTIHNIHAFRNTPAYNVEHSRLSRLGVIARIERAMLGVGW